MPSQQLATRPETNVVKLPPPPTIRRKSEFQFDSLLPTVGKLELTPEEKKILYAPVRDGDIEIRPNDGLIYLPWAFYAERLTQAFGISWSLLPSGRPAVQGNQVIVAAYLIIKGYLIGWAMGGAEYIPNNPKMGWSDVVESAMSNALNRIAGKRMGMGLKLWSREFSTRWVQENAEFKDVRDRRGNIVKAWVKKEGVKSTYTEEGVRSGTEDEPPPGDSSATIADAAYWRNKRGNLVQWISKAVPYYGGQAKHIIASLAKLATEGAINPELSDDAIFAIVDRHAGQQADKEQ